MAAAGLNVKTHDFVGHDGFLVGLRNDILVTDAVFIMGRGLFLCFNGLAALYPDPARWTDVLDMEVAQQGRNIGLINVGCLILKHVSAWVQAPFSAFALIPQILHFVHGGHVFEFQHEELVVFAAVKTGELLAAKEFTLIYQNGILAEFSDCLFQFRDKARLGIKPPRLWNFDIKEGFIIVNNDAAGLAPLIDAEHLNYELVFVLVVFLAAVFTAATTAAATQFGLGSRRLIAHLEIK